MQKLKMPKVLCFVGDKGDKLLFWRRGDIFQVKAAIEVAEYDP